MSRGECNSELKAKLRPLLKVPTRLKAGLSQTSNIKRRTAQESSNDLLTGGERRTPVEYSAVR